MNELVSIIVPIYNVELYLNRCVNSLLLQDYDNIEIILVDDGSPDKCGKICDEFAMQDSRVRVIHKKNGGLSDARNAGLAIAKGEFIAFVDSDDWVTTDYLSVMLNTLRETGCDICECEVVKTTGSADINYEKPLEFKLFNTEDALKELIYDKNMHQHVWNKLYRRECIINELFPVGKTNEDEFWTYRAFGNANKVVKINKILYYYFQRESSIMGVGYNLKRLDALEAKSIRQSYIEKRYPELRAIAENNLFASCIYSGQMTLKCLNSDEKVIAYKKIDAIQKRHKPGKRDCNLSISEGMWIGMAKFNFWMVCRLKNLLGKGF